MFFFPGESSNLEEAQKRAMKRVGRIGVTGRYFNLPRTLEDDFILDGKVLGTGFNGAVVSATSRHRLENPTRFAIKSFELSGVSRSDREQIAEELEIFLSMDHPHVGRLQAVYESEEHLSLVMECMDGGELFDRVCEKKAFTEKCAADATWQMLQAVNYIHHQGVAHRDLKLENFLYDAAGSDFLKLIDFGFSKFYRGKRMNEALGTLTYAAPEVLNRSYTCGSCDMWSLGVIVFILLGGYMPFNSDNDAEIAHAIRRGRYEMRNSRWGHISQEGRNFVKSLLVVNPKERLTAELALAHPWIMQRGGMTHAAGADRYPDIAQGFMSFARASRFRRACMQVMAWSLTLDERRQLRDAFIELSATQGGVVKKDDLENFLRRQICGEGKECPIVIEAMEALDVGPNDEIHYSDFLAAMMSCSELDSHEDSVRATFRRFDVNGMGFLDAQSLREVLGDGIDVDSIFEEVDADYDGRISVEEFVAHLKGGDHRISLSQLPQVQDGVEALPVPANSQFRSRAKRMKSMLLRNLMGARHIFGGAGGEHGGA